MVTIRSRMLTCFNPRTSIRYDDIYIPRGRRGRFQSTHLYKIRLTDAVNKAKSEKFQSTYLYKIRLLVNILVAQRKVSIHVPL